MKRLLALTGLAFFWTVGAAQDLAAQNLVITNARIIVGNGDVIVETEVVMADGDTFAAGWRVSASGGDPRIIDVYISGFSVAGHFGGVFERKSRGDIEWLNDFLGKKVSGSRTLALIP